MEGGEGGGVKERVSVGTHDSYLAILPLGGHHLLAGSSPDCPHVHFKTLLQLP